MKSSFLKVLFFGLSSGFVFAQDPTPILTTTENVTDVLTSPVLQTDKEVAKGTSDLETQNTSNQCLPAPGCGNTLPACLSQIDTHPSCQGFADSLMPAGYKERQWKSLFEIKYQPTDDRKRNQSTRADYQEYDFEDYYDDNTQKNLASTSDFDTEAKKIQDYWKENDLNEDGAGPPINEIRTQLLLDQILNPDFTKNDADMMAKIKAGTASMSDAEFLNFTAVMADYVEYNDERAAFEQTPEGGLGVVTPFQQMTDTKAGVCGDIHSMVAKVAEQRGWEAFTVGYALEGMQHVVTAMVNPNDPNNLMIVNYGNYESQSLNDGNSVNLTPTKEGWEEMGTQLRIFKNDKTGDGTGKMQQIATIPTPLGSFMNSLFKKEYEATQAMPQNQNFSKEVAGGETTKHKVVEKQDGNKIKDKFVTEGLIIYEGKMDNAEVYGIGVSSDVYKDIYKWDETQQKCVLKKSKYFGLALAGSLVDLTQTEYQDNYYVYLNIKGGTIYHLYQSDHFQFKGIIGYQIQGFGASYNEPEFLTADGNFSTFFQAVGDYKKNNVSVHVAASLETNAALRNQNLMTDFSALPQNVNPVAFNAVSVDANMSYKIDAKNTLVTNNNFTMTRVGGRVFLSTGIIHNNTSMMMSYQGGVKPIPIGNTLQNVNLLQNYNNMDGFRITASQNFSTKSGSITGTMSGYVGVSTTTTKPQPMAGATIKLNLNGNKKQKPRRR